MKGSILLALAIVAEVIATSALKASDGFTRPLPAILSVLGYGCAFYCLSLALRTIPLGTAYAIWSGVGIVLLALIGWLHFKQALGAAEIAGIALILAGVLLLRARF